MRCHRRGREAIQAGRRQCGGTYHTCGLSINRRVSGRGASRLKGTYDFCNMRYRGSLSEVSPTSCSARETNDAIGLWTTGIAIGLAAVVLLGMDLRKAARSGSLGAARLRGCLVGWWQHSQSQCGR